MSDKAGIILNIDNVDCINRTNNKIVFYYHKHNKQLNFNSEEKAKQVFTGIVNMIESNEK